MYFQKDYLMRQIEDMVRFIAKVILGKDLFKYEMTNEANLSKTDLLYAKIMTLVSQRKICEAEDVLYESIEKGNDDHAKIALDFYDTINGLSDDGWKTAAFHARKSKTALSKSRPFWASILTAYSKETQNG